MNNFTDSFLGSFLLFGEFLGLSATDPRIIVARIIRIGISFLGIVFLLIILYAGLLWMTAGGDTEKVQSAKRVLFNAIFGLLIIFSAYSIVRYLISIFTAST